MARPDTRTRRASGSWERVRGTPGGPGRSTGAVPHVRGLGRTFDGTYSVDDVLAALMGAFDPPPPPSVIGGLRDPADMPAGTGAAA